MLDRRDFLKRAIEGSTVIGLAPSIPAFLASTARASAPERDGRILVVVQLDGGNDGINTIVPLGDEGYPRHRKALRLPTERLIKIAPGAALHPSMSKMGMLLEEGRLAVVQGVGYPNPSRSHLRSMAIWHTARLEPQLQDGLGWLGRSLDRVRARVGSTSMFVGEGSPPAALRGRRSVPSALERPDDLAVDPGVDLERISTVDDGGDGELAAFVRRSMLDAYATADQMAAFARDDGDPLLYPTTGLGERLQLIARLIKSNFGTRVYYTIQAGYDTHSKQLPVHARLLGEFSEALGAFVDDMAASGLLERVVVLGFSEFGRRVAENASQGTDHGTAGPVFVAGGGLNGGLIGPTPSLVDLDNGDVKVSADFRSIYAAILTDWLAFDAERALGGAFDPISLFRKKRSPKPDAANRDAAILGQE